MIEIQIKIHNVPPHADGELRLEVLSPKAEPIGRDIHIDSDKDNVTHMGRAYTMNIENDADEITFLLKTADNAKYFQANVIDSIVEVDYEKDGKDVF